MRYKTFLLAIFAVITSILLAPAIKADQWDKGTVLTIGQSIQIPHRVLQPGTYVMRLLDSSWVGFYILGNPGRPTACPSSMVLSWRQLRTGICLSQGRVDAANLLFEHQLIGEPCKA
jgi:hypothetical protein